jgi:hypothetical protein
VFNAFRTGPDRLRYASRGIVDQISAALPFRAGLLLRRQDHGLIDKGRADGVKDGAEFEIVRKGRVEILNEGIGLVYSPDDVVGKLIVEKADEEVSAGRLSRQGFFDQIGAGDDVFLAPPKPGDSGAGGAAKSESLLPADPELRALLRILR